MDVLIGALQGVARCVIVGRSAFRDHLFLGAKRSFLAAIALGTVVGSLFGFPDRALTRPVAYACSRLVEVGSPIGHAVDIVRAWRLFDCIFKGRTLATHYAGPQNLLEGPLDPNVAWPGRCDCDALILSP